MTTTSAPTGGAQAPAADQGSGRVLLAVCLAALVFPLMITGMGVALPEIAGSVHTGLPSLQWALNGYNVMFCSLLLASGALADRIGRRRVFRAGITLFVLGAVLCMTATSIVVLDAGRFVSGIGAAAAVPSASAVLTIAFPGERRAKAFGAFGTVLGLGMAIGPSVAGLVVDAFGWRAVFGIPAAIALVALAMSGAMTESRDPSRTSVDWPGALTFSASLLCLILALIEGPQAGWGSPLAAGAFAASVVLLVAFVALERRRPQPLLDLALLGNRQFLGHCIRVTLTVASLASLLTYLPSFFIGAQGRSPQQAGLMLLLLTGPTVAFPAVAGILAKKVQARLLVIGAMLIGGIALAWLTVAGPHSSVGVLAGPLLLMGATVGIAFGLSDALALGSVPPQRSGTAAGLFNTMRISGEAIGIALFGSLLASMTASRLAARPAGDLGPFAGDTATPANAINSGQLGSALHGLTADAARALQAVTADAYASALHTVLAVMAGLLIVGTPLVAWLARPERGTAAGSVPEPVAEPAAAAH